MRPADIARKWVAREQGPEDGIPSWILVVMDVGWTERLLGEPAGAYDLDAVGLELRQKQVLGTAIFDQLVTTPRSQVESGFGGRVSAHQAVVDGIPIDGPEDVLRHYEQVVVPGLESAIARFPERAETIRAEWLASFRQLEERLGPETLLIPYGGVQEKPVFRYFTYGYEPYFTFFALYPEVQEEAFRLEGAYAEMHNGVLAQAIVDEGIPPVIRCDHDMTSAAGPMASIETLDRIYFPHLERAMRPLVDRGIQLLWHCDGNVNLFIPRLLEIGFSGFQGFQYECDMDYPTIAKMRRRDGEPLTLIVGASVTTTMVFGTPDDVRREVDWLVRESGDSYLALAATSSICPGTPWENIDALVERMCFYQEHGRAGLGLL
jgi:hypothetical protein